MLFEFKLFFANFGGIRADLVKCMVFYLKAALCRRPSLLEGRPSVFFATAAWECRMSSGCQCFRVLSAMLSDVDFTVGMIIMQQYVRRRVGDQVSIP